MNLETFIFEDWEPETASDLYLLLALRPRPEASQRFRLLNERIDELHQEIVRRRSAIRSATRCSAVSPTAAR